MAEVSEKIILEVDLDTGGLADKLVIVKGSIDNVKKALKELEDQKKTFQEQGKSVETINKQIVDYNTTLRQLTGTQRELQKQIDLTTKAQQVEEGSIEALRIKLALLVKQYNALSAAERQAATGTDLQTTIKATSDELKILEASVGNTTRNVGNYEEALKPLHKELVDIKNTHQLFGKTVSGVNSIMSASTLIFGENKDATELQKKITNGLAIVQELMNVKLGFSNGLLLAQSVRMKATSAATVTATTATSLFGRMQQFLQVQFGLSATAARGFAIALAATGIGAIVILVGLLVSQLATLFSQTEKVTAATDDWRKSMKEADDSFSAAIDRMNSKIDGANKKIIDNAQTQIELAKLRGASITTIFNMEQALLNKQIDMYRRARLTDEVEYNNLLNRKLELTAQYYRDLAEKERKANTDLVALTDKSSQTITTAFGDKVVKGVGGALAEINKVYSESVPATVQVVTDSLAVINDAAFQNQQDMQLQLDEMIEAFQSQELASAQNLANDLFNVYQISTDNRIKLLEEQADAGIITEQQANKEIRKIKRQQAENEKKFAAFNIIINTARAIAESNPVVPLMIFAAIAGAAQLAAVLAQPVPTFAKGGQVNQNGSSFLNVGGRSHAQGGTKYYGEDGNRFEVEKGEVIAVVNKRSSGMLGSLSWINQMGGGVPFFERGGMTYLEDGGFAARTISNPITTQFNGENIVEAIRQMNIVVRVSDINILNDKLANVRVRSDI